jgi:subtilisin family serine protease
VYPEWDRDTINHGTHVAGIISAMRNGKGVAGVSAEGANLYTVRVMPDGSALTSTCLQALEMCLAELDRRKAAAAVPDMKLIVSMSLGTDAVSIRPMWNSVVNQLMDQRSDVLLVAAAGNSGFTGGPQYPAGQAQVLAVAAVDPNEAVASFSSRQSYVAVAGAGEQGQCGNSRSSSSSSSSGLLESATLADAGCLQLVAALLDNSHA